MASPVVYTQSGNFFAYSDVLPGFVNSGLVGSGQLDRFHMDSGCVVDYFPCGQTLSGLLAVSWDSGGCFIVTAERQSGRRLPAIGVVAGNFVSGQTVPIVRFGAVGWTASGVIASGGYGFPLYVGSGGLIVNLSGFMGGASSGVGPNMTVTGGVSGQLVQRIGIPLSGAIYVDPDSNVTSGLYSGLLGQY